MLMIFWPRLNKFKASILTILFNIFGSIRQPMTGKEAAEFDKAAIASDWEQLIGNEDLERRANNRMKKHLNEEQRHPETVPLKHKFRLWDTKAVGTLFAKIALSAMPLPHYQDDGHVSYYKVDGCRVSIHVQVLGDCNDGSRFQD